MMAIFFVFFGFAVFCSAILVRFLSGEAGYIAPGIQFYSLYRAFL
jgi:hypothetical protein